MVQFTLQKFGWLIISLTTFFASINETFLGRFFEWIPFIGIVFHKYMVFSSTYFVYIIALSSILIFLRWTKNVYVLLAFALLVGLFLRFAISPLLTPVSYLPVLFSLLLIPSPRFWNKRLPKVE
jgi:hypothetical protein